MKDDITLRVKGLAKSYGRVEAVREASFSVRSKAITAFLGENGAGKTTTIRAILGFLKPDRGRIDLRAERVGYVPEHPVFFPWLRGWEILRSTARLFGVGPWRGSIETDIFRRRVGDLSEKIGFDSQLLERRVQTFSLGNQKKFSYLQSLLIAPDFLIIDEPFLSLDPLSIKRVRDLFLGLKAGGTTLFLSSHLISEMEKISDEVIILKQGRVVGEISVERIRREGPGGFDLEAFFLSFHRGPGET